MKIWHILQCFKNYNPLITCNNHLCKYFNLINIIHFVPSVYMYWERERERERERLSECGVNTSKRVAVLYDRDIIVHCAFIGLCNDWINVQQFYMWPTRTTKSNVRNDHRKIDCDYRQRPKIRIILENKKIKPDTVLKPEKQDMSSKSRTYVNPILFECISTLINTHKRKHET